VTPRRVAAAALVLVLAAGCSVGNQDEPEILAAENVPDGLLDPTPPTSTTTPETATSSPVPIYFVRERRGDARLAAVEREVAEVGSADQRVRLLFQEQPTEEESEQGLSSVIPPDTFRAVRTNGESATIDLTEEFLTVQGQGQVAAFAQVVWTVTGTPGIQQVRFRIDGEPKAALLPGGESRSRPVDRSDYRALRPVS
jgi:spore germination protein GerM